MPVKKADLITAVNRELQNYTRRGSGEAVADGVLQAFLVAPHGYQIVDNANFTVYLDDVSTQLYTMDFDNGVCTMNSAPSSGVVVSFVYDYVYWSDALVIQALNAAITNLFPNFYVVSNDTSTVTDDDTYEYDLPALTEFVSGVFWREDATDPWKRLARGKRYEIIWDASSPQIKFYDTLGTGTLRITSIQRPAVFSTSDYTAVATSDISVADPTIVTTATHSLTSGDLVYFSAVDTAPELNLTYQTVTVLSATTFTVPVAITSVTDDVGTITKTDSIENTCKLPARAQYPIISYACYYLLTQKTIPRVRGDVAAVTQGVGVLSPRQMNDAANALYLRYEMQLRTSKMNPWISR